MINYDALIIADVKPSLHSLLKIEETGLSVPQGYHTNHLDNLNVVVNYTASRMWVLLMGYIV